jgi:subtilase family serine protease
MSVMSTNSVINSKNSSGKAGWYVVGGTSAGAPQWAAIAALSATSSSTRISHIISHTLLYSDKANISYSKYFRDIISGKNGTCTYYCTARKHYDYVTGIGSPLTYVF